MAAKQVIPVAAGVIMRADGRVLVARRPDGKHAGGHWEFPGGKIGAHETALAGLVRELQEELGVAVRQAELLLSYAHEYADRTVELHVFRVTDYTGNPAGLEGQPLRWAAVDQLMDMGLLPADAPIVAALAERQAGR